ncbi:hypothetical protein M5K25_003558 [Dendrobium thyrsiflorum]|uniref:BED-type domain-containing protein n=1 Tax=Dendrobium thyrsiflorum TaxID=117978 RepID=A0ABD0VJM3_DENTH
MSNRVVLKEPAVRHMRMEALETQNAASNCSVREKVDIAWNHFIEIKGTDGKRQYKCLYCGIAYKGGGINRMKQYLAGVKGNITACKLDAYLCSMISLISLI